MLEEDIKLCISSLKHVNDISRLMLQIVHTKLGPPLADKKFDDISLSRYKMESIVQDLTSVGQEHLLKFYDELTDENKIALMQDLQEVDWKLLDNIYKDQVMTLLTDQNELKPSSKIDDNLLQVLPNDCIDGTTRCNSKTLEQYRSTGLKYIGQGKVAALLLAGGQGTRLGVEYPKGMYDVGLPSKKSLFQLQAERILNLCRTESLQDSQLIWYIMTSGSTLTRTKNYFTEHNYFGLDRDKIVFFEQDKIPCFDFKGKVFLEDKHRVSKCPNGNGGLYEALHKGGVLNHMKNNGVEYLHVYCVDNILVRICDPVFMGYCITKGADVGAKVVEKLKPDESVGIICKVNNRFKVIEYSEISQNIANKRDEISGKLVFNAGNICEHFFKVSFLATIKDNLVLRYHLATKKIPHISLETGQLIRPKEANGIKLEKFVFDVFEFTNNFVAWEVKREDEFSPLKNADGTDKDNPTTARAALMRSYELGIIDC